MASSNRRKEEAGAHVRRLQRPPHLRVPSLQFRRQLPHFAIFIRVPALGRSGWANGGRSSFLRLSRLPGTAKAALAHVIRADGRARIQPLRKPRGADLPRRRRCREFTNTNGNQGSWRRGPREAPARMREGRSVGEPSGGGPLVPAVRGRTRDLAVRCRQVFYCFLVCLSAP